MFGLEQNRLPSAAEDNRNLSSLVRQSKLPAWLLRLDNGCVLEASDAMASLFGGCREQLLRRDGTQLVVEGAKARRRMNLLATGELESYRVQGRAYRGLDGTEFAVDVWMQALTHETPRRVGLGIVLPAQDPPSPTTVEVSSPRRIALGSVDECWRVDRISADIEELAGYSSAEVVGEPISSIVEPADWPSFLVTVGHGLQGGATTMRLRLRRGDGPPRVCRVLITPLAGACTAFAFALYPDDSTLGSEGRVWELEAHLRRISREVTASGVLACATLTPPATAVPAMSGLSFRQLEIVTSLLGGARVPMIAEQMFLSQSTVRNHLTSIYRKLGVRSQQELIAHLRTGRMPDHPQEISPRHRDIATPDSRTRPER